MQKFDVCVEKIPWRRKWQPIPIFLPGKSHRQRLAGYSPWVIRVRHDWVIKTSPWHYCSRDSLLLGMYCFPRCCPGFCGSVCSCCQPTICEWGEPPLWFSTFPTTTAIALLDQWCSQRPWRVSGEKPLLLFLILPSSFRLDIHWLFQQSCPGDRCIGFMVP